MIKLGPYFNPTGLKPEITLAVLIINEAAHSIIPEIIELSSGTDRKHGPKSLHYVGYAVDFHWHGYTIGDANQLSARLLMALGPRYDVVVESDHIHVEYQPK
jgi:hypothetical protein